MSKNYVYSMCGQKRFESLESILSRFEPCADDSRLKFVRGIRRKLDLEEFFSADFALEFFKEEIELEHGGDAINFLSELSEKQNVELSKIICDYINKNKLYNGVYVVEEIENVIYNKKTKKITSI